jgi:hypothetical protein
MLPILTAALPIVGKVLDRVIPDKAAAEQAKAELAVMHLNGELKGMEIAMSAIVMEAQSADPWTSRARPSFLYIIYIYILSAIPFAFWYTYQPIEAQLAIAGMGQFLEAIPGELYALFGAGYLGYGTFRMVDKNKQSDMLAQLKS